MKTVVLGPMPPELAELIEQRRRKGLDRFDEMWEGEYHMVPAPTPSHALLDTQIAALLLPVARERSWFALGPFDLGDPDDYRIPDWALLGEEPRTTWVPRALLVVEILSPHDEAWQKLDFYAAHTVEEILFVDADQRSVTILIRDESGPGYEEAEASRLLGLSAEAIAGQLTWPARS